MNVAVISLAFLAMLAMMLVGLPIAVAMALVGIVGGISAYGAPFMDSIAPVVWGVQNENLLTCIPLFVLLGELLLRSGIADRMYVALSAWLGGLPGGLLHTNIGSCALFAATSAHCAFPACPQGAAVDSVTVVPLIAATCTTHASKVCGGAGTIDGSTA